MVVDATNPVGPGLTHGLGSARAGAQHVAELVPEIARSLREPIVYPEDMEDESGDASARGENDSDEEEYADDEGPIPD